MPRRTITGFSNPTVKVLRSLRDKKHRKSEGKFLAEGLRLLTDARESGRLPEMLVMADVRDEHPLLEALVTEVDKGGGETAHIARPVLDGLHSKLLTGAVGAQKPVARTRVVGCDDLGDALERAGTLSSGGSANPSSE